MICSTCRVRRSGTGGPGRRHARRPARPLRCEHRQRSTEPVEIPGERTTRRVDLEAGQVKTGSVREACPNAPLRARASSAEDTRLLDCSAIADVRLAYLNFGTTNRGATHSVEVGRPGRLRVRGARPGGTQLVHHQAIRPHVVTLMGSVAMDRWGTSGRYPFWHVGFPSIRVAGRPGHEPAQQASRADGHGARGKARKAIGPLGRHSTMTVVRRRLHVLVTAQYRSTGQAGTGGPSLISPRASSARRPRHDGQRMPLS